MFWIIQWFRTISISFLRKQKEKQENTHGIEKNQSKSQKEVSVILFLNYTTLSKLFISSSVMDIFYLVTFS